MNLVVNHFGASLKVKDGQFIVRWEDQSRKVPIPKVDTIFLSKATLVSAEAISLAVDHQIDLVFVERSGQPFARVWSPKFGSVSTIRKNQLDFAASRDAVSWICKILSWKVENQVATLLTLGGPDDPRQDAIDQTLTRLQAVLGKIQEVESTEVKKVAARLRGLEGTASRLYLQEVSQLLPEPYQFAGRSQRPAKDMFNCMLNYAYGILYNDIESALIRAGVDPYLGVLHRDEYNRPVLVYDWIEPFRVWAEYVVIDLCRQQVIFKEFFNIRPNGSFWLEAPGKRILIQSFNDYMEEVITLDRLHRSRRNHIRRQIEQFAAMLKEYKKPASDISISPENPSES
jgi:CRISPR-associated protein Cas1